MNSDIYFIPLTVASKSIILPPKALYLAPFTRLLFEMSLIALVVKGCPPGLDG
jgi:hypothetical protein